MIQFNLLPDIKLEYIRAKRTKRIVITVSVVVASAVLLLAILLFLEVNVGRSRHINNLGNDINRLSSELQSKEDLSKILTIQNQLGSINDLHDKKPAVSRMFVTYLDQITPNQVSIDELELDMETGAVSITGEANQLSTVNKFVDTVKFTKYSQGEEEVGNAFKDVVLQSFGKNANGRVNYSFSFLFEPDIFDLTQDITLNVPNIITTRSVTEKPGVLFKPNPELETEGAN